MSDLETSLMRPFFLALVATTFLVAAPLALGRNFTRWRRSEGLDGAPLRFLWARAGGGRFCALDLVGVFFLLLMLSAGLLFEPPAEKGTEGITRTVVLSNILFWFFLSTLVVVRVFRGKGSAMAHFGLRPRKWGRVLLPVPVVIVVTWLFLTLMAVGGWNDWVIEHAGGGLQEVVTRLADTSDPVMLGLLVVSAVVVAPVAEELVFRGYIFGVFSELIGPLFGMLASGLFFSLAHANLLGFPALFFLGVLLALSYHLSRSLWTPILAHATFNLVTVVNQLVISQS